MDYYPLFLNLKSQACLVVGGGEVAFRKSQSLLKAGAHVTLVAPDITPQLRQLINDEEITYISKGFSPEHLSEKRLVIAATNDSALNRWISKRADEENILVNVPDDLKACRFIVPAIIDRSPLIIAVSSGGTAPLLSRLLRQKLETMIPASYGDLAKFAAHFRDQVKNKFSTLTARRRFWEGIFEGPIANRVLNGQITFAENEFKQALALHAKDEGTKTGEVFIVGAGPGDPELLTLKALRLMQQADIVFYDNLASSDVLNLVRRDAIRVSVAKKKNHHKMTQAKINAAMIEHAKAGKRVCRLKGGDPFIFGRGGEEVEALIDAEVPFQIVPGITAASGCTTYAGIPLTHRDHADTVTFVTGHKKDNGKLDIDFKHLAKDRQTIVFYMGLGNLPEICKRLQFHGLASDIPAAAIEQGTYAHQRVLCSTLKNLASDIEDFDFQSPTLIVIGKVVSLANKLHWFGNPPIQGKCNLASDHLQDKPSLEFIPRFNTA